MTQGHGSLARTPSWCWAAAVLLAMVSLPGADVTHGKEERRPNLAKLSAEDAELPLADNEITLVHLQCQFLSATSRAMDELKVAWQAMPASPAGPRPDSDELLAQQEPVWGEGRITVEKRLPTFYALLNDADVRSVMAQTKQTASNMAALGRPTLATADGVVASCEVAKSRPFVIGVRQGKPIIDEYDIGLRAFLRPVLVANGVQLTYQLESKQIRSVEDIELRTGPRTGIKVQVPEVSNVCVVGKNMVPAGDTLLIRMQAGEADSNATLLLALVKPTRVNAKEILRTVPEHDTSDKGTFASPQELHATTIQHPWNRTRVRSSDDTDLDERAQWKLSLRDCIRMGVSSLENTRSLGIDALTRVADPSESTSHQLPVPQDGGLRHDEAATVLLTRGDETANSFDAEINVRNYLLEVARAYWALYFQHHKLDAARSGFASAHTVWARLQSDHSAEEAQARAQYFSCRAQLQQAKSDLLHQESRLRYLVGLTAHDGRLLCPIDKPTKAKVMFDWKQVKSQAIERRPEVRRARWVARQHALQLTAAKRRLLPQLDALLLYRFLDLGGNHRRTDADNRKAIVEPQHAHVNNSRERTIGAEFQLPIGLRDEIVQIETIQGQQQRKQKRLQDVQLEVIHQLSTAVRRLSDAYQFTNSAYNTLIAIQDQVDSAQAAFEVESVPLDIVLDSQSLRTQRETDYFRALTEYQLAIMEVHHRKGTLLATLGCELAAKTDVDGALDDVDQQRDL